MKQVLISLILITLFGLFSPSFVGAQGIMNMMGVNNSGEQSSDGHTAEGEAEGKGIWDKLQAQEIGCENLSDDDFHNLGMYFMGLMAGESHEEMDSMMERMMGEEGADQMHIGMGKRMSGCEADAPIPQTMIGGGMIPMMGMMGGGGNYMMGNFGTNPMGLLGWGFGWVFMILFWGLIIVGIIALIKWIANQGKSQTQDKSALEILKERYAKGEIEKKEFEKKKKDLT
jgi:putative membrane protein